MEFIILDESYLEQAAQLYKESFAGEPWYDDWSDETQLIEYIKEVSGGYNSLNYGLLIEEKLWSHAVFVRYHPVLSLFLPTPGIWTHCLLLSA